MARLSRTAKRRRNTKYKWRRYRYPSPSFDLISGKMQTPGQIRRQLTLCNDSRPKLIAGRTTIWRRLTAQALPRPFRFARRAWYSARASGNPTNVRRRQFRHRTGYCSSANRSRSLQRKRDSRKLDEEHSEHVMTLLLLHTPHSELPTKPGRLSGI